MRPARLRSEVTTGCYTEPLAHLRVGAGEAGAYHPDYAVKDTYASKDLSPIIIQTCSFEAKL